MAIATVDPGDEVRAVDHNSIVGLLNGTANDGATEFAQPVKLYQFDDPDIYSLVVGNQDTTNGLIQAWQYGPVGSATTVARMTKAGLIANIYRNDGPVYELEAFAADPTAIRGEDPDEDPDAAWLAAFQKIQSSGGGTILLGPYTYLNYSSGSGWQDNCIIRGAGRDATTIKRRDSQVIPPIFFLGKSNSGVCDLTIDDNYTGNPNALACAVSIDGPGCFAYRIRVKEFNLDAINCAGIDNVVQDCILEGLAPVSYASAIPTTNYQSRYGINTPSVVGYPCERIKIIGNTVTGCRSAGIAAGGPGAVIMGNTVRDCHRGDYGTIPGVQGGSIALTITSTSVLNDTLPSRSVIIGNTIGPMATVVGAGGAGGIEIDSSNQIVIANNTISDVSNFGISVNSSLGNTRDILITGNTLHSINTAAGLPGAGGSVALHINGTNASFSTAGVVVANNSFFSCTNTIWTEGFITGYAFHGNVFTSNTNGWTKDDLAADWWSSGNMLVAGSHANLPALRIPGTGNRILADLSNATAANRLMFQSSTTNGNSTMSVLPNGTGTTAGWAAYGGTGGSDPDNASALVLNVSNVAVQINSTKTGTGTAQPLLLRHDSTTRIELNATGMAFFAGTPVAKPTVSGSKGGNAALTSLMAALGASGLNLVTDSTS